MKLVGYVILYHLPNTIFQPGKGGEGHDATLNLWGPKNLQIRAMHPKETLVPSPQDFGRAKFEVKPKVVPKRQSKGMDCSSFST